MVSLRLGNHRIHVPRSRGWRIVLGCALILGGIVGFLPVVGFWMAPLGVMVLSVDFHMVRRWRRRLRVRWGRWHQKRYGISDTARKTGD